MTIYFKNSDLIYERNIYISVFKQKVLVDYIFLLASRVTAIMWYLVAVHIVYLSKMKLGTMYKKFQNFYFVGKQGLKYSTGQYKITQSRLVTFWNLISCQAVVFGTEFLLKSSNFILRKLKVLYKIWVARKWPQFSSIKY